MSFYKTFEYSNLYPTTPLVSEFNIVQEYFNKNHRQLQVINDPLIYGMHPDDELDPNTYVDLIVERVEEQLHLLDDDTDRELGTKLDIMTESLPINTIFFVAIDISDGAIAKFTVESPFEIWKLPYLLSLWYQKAYADGEEMKPIDALDITGRGKIRILDRIAICELEVES